MVDFGLVSSVRGAKAGCGVGRISGQPMGGQRRARSQHGCVMGEKRAGQKPTASFGKDPTVGRSEGGHDQDKQGNSSVARLRCGGKWFDVCLRFACSREGGDGDRPRQE